MRSRSQDLRTWISVILLSGMLFSACSEEVTEPRDEGDPTPFDQLYFATTHNSYSGGHKCGEKSGDRRSVIEQLDSGVRCLEFDVHDNGFGNYGYRLGHDEPGDEVATGNGNPTTSSLSSWLDLLAGWSATHPDHAPITLYLDLKDPLTDNRSYSTGNLAHLNDNLQTAFGSSLFTAAALNSAGWPSITALKGRVLTVLSGLEPNRRAYLRDAGSSPSVAMNSAGQIIEAHDNGDGELWYWTGQLQGDGSVDWRRHGWYDTGEEPALALNNDGLVVEVHEDDEANDDKLWYRVGQLDENYEILWYTSGGILFPGEDEGIDPTVAFLDLDGLTIREVHQSDQDEDRWYWDGVYNETTHRIDWGAHGENLFSQFIKTVATVGTNSVRVGTGAHGDFGTDTLLYKHNSGEWRRVQYTQLAFVEVQRGGGEALNSEGLWFYAATASDAAARDWAEGWRRAGRIVRLWGFNSENYINSGTPVNFAATDHPFADWYVNYCAAISCVE